MTNVAVLIGRLARPAEPRDLPSGDRLVQYEVTIPSLTGRAESVPVVWFDAPASAEVYDVDEKVVVVGRVRRRFFQGAAGTQSHRGGGRCGRACPPGQAGPGCGRQGPSHPGDGVRVTAGPLPGG